MGVSTAGRISMKCADGLPSPFLGHHPQAWPSPLKTLNSSFKRQIIFDEFIDSPEWINVFILIIRWWREAKSLFLMVPANSFVSWGVMSNSACSGRYSAVIVCVCTWKIKQYNKTKADWCNSPSGSLSDPNLRSIWSGRQVTGLIHKTPTINDLSQIWWLLYLDFYQ